MDADTAKLKSSPEVANGCANMRETDRPSGSSKVSYGTKREQPKDWVNSGPAQKRVRKPVVDKEQPSTTTPPKGLVRSEQEDNTTASRIQEHRVASAVDCSKTAAAHTEDAERVSLPATDGDYVPIISLGQTHALFPVNELELYSLYRLEDVLILCQHFRKKIHEFFIREGVDTPFQSEWTEDEDKVYYVESLIHDYNSLYQQQEVLESRIGAAPGRVWTDLIDQHVREPFGLGVQCVYSEEEGCLMDLALTEGMTPNLKTALALAFKVDTLDGVADGVNWLDEQLALLKTSPLHYQSGEGFEGAKSRFLFDAEGLRAQWAIAQTKMKIERSQREKEEKDGKKKAVAQVAPHLARRESGASKAITEEPRGHPLQTHGQGTQKTTVRSPAKDSSTDAGESSTKSGSRKWTTKQDLEEGKDEEVTPEDQEALYDQLLKTRDQIIAGVHPRFRLPPASIEKLKQGMPSAATSSALATGSYASVKPATPSTNPRAGDAAAGTRPPTPASSPVATPLVLTSSLAHTISCLPTASPAYATDSQPLLDSAGDKKTASAGDRAAGTTRPRPATSSATASGSAVPAASPPSTTTSNPSGARSTAPSVPRARDPAASTTRVGPPPNAPKGPKKGPKKRRR